MKLSTYFQAFLFIATTGSLQQLALAEESSSSNTILSHASDALPSVIKTTSTNSLDLAAFEDPSDSTPSSNKHPSLDSSPAPSDEFLSTTASLRGGNAPRSSLRGTTTADGGRHKPESPMLLGKNKEVDDNNGGNKWSSSGAATVMDRKLRPRVITLGLGSSSSTWCPTPDREWNCNTAHAAVDCRGCLYSNMCFAKAAGIKESSCKRTNSNGPFN